MGPDSRNKIAIKGSDFCPRTLLMGVGNSKLLKTTHIAYGVVYDTFLTPRGRPGPRGATPALFSASGRMRYLNTFLGSVAGASAFITPRQSFGRL